jgi:hypothetical protein
MFTVALVDDIGNILVTPVIRSDAPTIEIGTELAFAENAESIVIEFVPLIDDTNFVSPFIVSCVTPAVNSEAKLHPVPETNALPDVTDATPDA